MTGRTSEFERSENGELLVRMWIDTDMTIVRIKPDGTYVLRDYPKLYEVDLLTTLWPTREITVCGVKHTASGQKSFWLEG